VTDLSGRGLGLAIVKEKTEKLGGRVYVETRLGKGTAFRMVLPIALAAFRGLLVRVLGRIFVLPAISVERVTLVRTTEISTVENRETIALNGRAMSLARLGTVLEIPDEEAATPPPAYLPVVILGALEERVAFVVDEVLHDEEVLVKQLAPPLLRVRNVAGATVLASGQLVPVLNPSDLLKSARKVGPGGRRVRPVSGPAGAEPKSKSVLVAEDSITSRTLLKGILESAGYRVKTAVDGVEAMEALRTGDFDLVVSDVQMPRLNGFDLTARIRAERRLAEIPVVLVTALSSAEDRERGIDVGASAYLVKSDFDQSNLLDIVRRLT
jgi:two-component system chemotaxis sensor kinase CheA